MHTSIVKGKYFLAVIPKGKKYLVEYKINLKFIYYFLVKVLDSFVRLHLIQNRDDKFAIL